MANLIRVKDKFQITIPVALRTAAAVELGDYLEATAFEDGILFRPQRPAKAAPAQQSIMAFLQKTRESTRSREAIDEAVAADRAAWA